MLVRTWLLLFMLVSATGFADSAETLFSAGKFKEAAESLQSTWNLSDKSSPLIAYNAGTAWAQAGDPVKAYGFLLKAERLSPGDKDIRNNLQFVQEKLSPDAKNIMPAFPLGVSIARVSPLSGTLWLLITMTCLLLGLLGLVLQKQTASARIALIAALVFALPTVMIQWELRSPVAVVIGEKPSLRSGPAETFSEIQTLPAGAWISIQEEQDGWNKIRFNSLRDKRETVGWIHSADLFLL